MKKLLFLVTAFLFFFIFPGPSKADEGWIINNFSSQINVRTDGKVFVTEIIDADFGTLQKHGILRDIPVVYYTSGEPIYIEVSINSVNSSAATTVYQVYKKGDFLEVKIGDPDKFISGKVQYQIIYLVTGALKAFPDHDELYWDVTGNNWPVSIKKASATVSLAQGSIWDLTCYEGGFGSKESCSKSKPDATNAYFKTTRQLATKEDFTVVVGFPKNTFPILMVNAPVKTSTYSYDYSNLSTPELNLWVFIPIVSVGLFMILKLWSGSGKDPDTGNETIIVEYKAPNGLKPAEMGTLMDEKADTLDVTATIIHLASRGFLTIEEKGKKWIFGTTDYIFKRMNYSAAELTEYPPESSSVNHSSPQQAARYSGSIINHDETDLPGYEKLLLNKIFDKGDSVKLSELKLNFYKDLALVKKEIYKNVLDKKLFFTDPEKTRNIYIGFGLTLAVSGGISSFIFFSEPTGTFLAITLSLLLLGVALMIVSSSMPKRTFLGRRLYIKCLGYKLFLEKVETYKQRFLEDKNLFNEVLPYTIIFGITEKFAKAFKDLGITQPQPDWYISSRPFNLYYFGTSMNSLSSSLTSAIAQAPGKGNFASGGSGFGGGGFSGGGFGGGGGGSW